MVEIRLFGKFIEKAEKQSAGIGITSISITGNEKVKDVLKKCGVDLDKVGDLFINHAPGTLEDLIKDNARISVFPKENHFPWINIY